MRILILTNYFYPEIGAAPSRIYNMANGLKKCKHDVEVIVPLPNYSTGKIFKKYNYANGFNKMMTAIKLIGCFKGSLKTTIQL